jgi:hypothetical protein
MKLNPAQKEPAVLAVRCSARGMPAGALSKRLPAGLAVLLGERPFPQPCREVHPRWLPV